MFTVAGLAMLAFGVLSIPFTIMGSLDRSAMTKGTVVGVKMHPTLDDTLYLPKVTFVPKGGGRSIEFTSKTGTDGWKNRVGESVAVRYDPADLTNAKIDSIGQTYGLSFTTIVLGAVFLFIGLRDDWGGESLLERIRRRNVCRNRDKHPAA